MIDLGLVVHRQLTQCGVQLGLDIGSRKIRKESLGVLRVLCARGDVDRVGRRVLGTWNVAVDLREREDVTSDGTVGKALDVLDQVANFGRPVRFSDVLADSAFPKPTLYRLLQTLVSQNMLT